MGDTKADMEALASLVADHLTAFEPSPQSSYEAALSLLLALFARGELPKGPPDLAKANAYLLARLRDVQ